MNDTLKAVEQNFLKFLQSPSQFVVPIYQRKYSWSIPQCKKLLQDVLVAGKDDESFGHFTGSIVYITKDVFHAAVINQLSIIDGQQRLTTLSLMILALRNALEIQKKEIGISTRKLTNYYLVNSDEEDDLFYKLVLTEGDNQAIRSILDSDKAAIDAYKESRIVQNYNYFFNEMMKSELKVVYEGLKKLMIIDVSLEQGKDNPQLIFESLNSTGLDLSQSDLIRNYILMDLDPKLQSTMYRKYWLKIEQLFTDHPENAFDRFSRDYLTIKTGRIPRQDRIYESFKRYFKSAISKLGLEQVVKDFYDYSKIFADLLSAVTPNQKVNALMQEINELRVNVAYPFLVQTYHDFDNKVINQEQLITIYRLVESYVFRRAVVGIPTNSLNKTFATLNAKIDKAHYLDSFCYELLQLDSYKRFPSDEEFERELKIKDIYNFQRSKYLLSKLENFDTKEIIDLNKYSIEHIMPQTLNEKWKEILGQDWKTIHTQYLNRLGNLTLTRYNSELSNQEFEGKRKMKNGFIYSPIRLNRMLAEVEQWDPSAIDRRGNLLSRRTLNIWQYPSVSPDYCEQREETVDNVSYTIEDYEFRSKPNLELFTAIQDYLINLNADITVKYNKHYVVFRFRSNLTSVMFTKEGISVNINASVDELTDPKGLLRDLRGIGHWATGESEIKIFSPVQLDDVYQLIHQAYAIQMEI
ncbi:hypothetical protein St703_23970 [Sporolactobacillus terrae]|uniref:DUF262 domain-containing protein n=1 Tax=Sporolactobacillus terrae TaxID=269673 RepID=A0A5K7WZH3_9BACL|nr:hypothetical protein St703_23970 [Sporolactobacillus terrae]